MRPSMGSVGDSYDNALCESFFATLECELIEQHHVRNQADARKAVFDFIEVIRLREGRFGLVEVLEDGSTDTHRPMGNKKNFHLALSDHERTGMRKHRIRKAGVLGRSADELAALLDVPVTRAEEIRALADFQRIPSIGIELARDLIYLGYTSLDELNGTSGAELTDEFERRKGYRTDPCVEDQFRLVVDFARNGDNTKRWWDFTAERKAYRASVGYPDDRPEVSWTEILRPKGRSG